MSQKNSGLRNSFLKKASLNISGILAVTTALSLIICNGENLLAQQTPSTSSQTKSTYAERLGFPKGAKVIIYHVDDAGMSYNSNQGAINSIEKGVATSTSIMMPCPWAAGFAEYAREKDMMPVYT